MRVRVELVAFDLTLEHGRCVGVRIPETDAALDALAAALAPGDQERAAAMPKPRRRTFLAGRSAMREALARLGRAPGTVPTDDRGAPVLPPGLSGSITHKVANGEAIAAALVAAEGSARVGVDLELDAARPHDIAHRVLTPAELEEIAPMDAGARAREVLLRFSAKEAIYKALDPFVRRYVGFLEVEVTPRPDGTADVRALLREATDGSRAFAMAVRWQRFEGLVLTTARVSSTSPSSSQIDPSPPASRAR